MKASITRRLLSTALAVTLTLTAYAPVFGSEAALAPTETSSSAAEEVSAPNPLPQEEIPDGEISAPADESLVTPLGGGPIPIDGYFQATGGKVYYSKRIDSIDIISVDASVTSIVIPESIEGLPVLGSFGNAYIDAILLTSITLSSQYNAGYSSAFSRAPALEEIIVPPTNPHHVVVNSLLLNKDEDLLWLCPPAKKGTVTIPDTVKEIFGGAFRSCKKLETIHIPDSVHTLGHSSFLGCSVLSEVTIGSGVSVINGGTFTGCDSLASIIIPSSVKTIEGSAFRNMDNLGYVQFMNPDTVIAEDAFEFGKTIFFSGSKGSTAETIANAHEKALFCNGSYPTKGGSVYYLKHTDHIEILGRSNEVTLLNTYTPNWGEIKLSVFRSNFLEIPSEIQGLPVTKIGSLYNGSWTTNIFIPPSVTTINNPLPGLEYYFNGKIFGEPNSYAESYANANSRFIFINGRFGTIPATNGNGYYSTYKIKSDNGQEYTVMTLLGFDKTVTAITLDEIEGNSLYVRNVFGDLTNLKTVHIGSNVSLDSSSSTFASCPSLTNFTVDAANPNFWAIDGVLFEKYDSKEKSSVSLLVYPRGKTDTTYSIPNGVHMVDEYAFRGNDVLTTVHISSSVNRIGQEAFRGCYKLQTVTLPSSVTEIGQDAFADTLWYSKAKENNTTDFIVIGDGVLVEYTGTGGVVEVPDTVKYVSLFFHHGIKSTITSLMLPDSIKIINNTLFHGLGALSQVVIPPNITYIGDYYFSGCSKLRSVIIPPSITEIGRNVFGSCPDVTIYGTAGSYAETYATKNNIPFKTGELPAPPIPVVSIITTAVQSGSTDLLTVPTEIAQGTASQMDITVTSDWSQQTPGVYLLTQGSRNIKESTTGNFQVQPGLDFEPGRAIYAVLMNSQGQVVQRHRLSLTITAPNVAPPPPEPSQAQNLHVVRGKPSSSGIMLDVVGINTQEQSVTTHVFAVLYNKTTSALVASAILKDVVLYGEEMKTLQITIPGVPDISVYDLKLFAVKADGSMSPITVAQGY